MAMQSIKRIDNFDLPNRGMFSAIYGPGMDDVFLGADLRYLDVYEAVYRSFKAAGYTVVFYSQEQHHNFFSYRKADLAEVYNLTPSRASAGATPAAGAAPARYVAQVRSPFGRRRMGGSPAPAAAPAPAAEPDYDQIQRVDEGPHSYFRIADSVDPFSIIDAYVKRKPGARTAFVFATATSDSYPNAQQYQSTFELWRNKFKSQGYGTRIVMMYSLPTTANFFDNSSFFRQESFCSMLKGVSSDGNSAPAEAPGLYCLSGPEKEEFRALLNRRRLCQGMQGLVGGLGIDRLATRLAQITTPAKAGQQALPGKEETLSHYRDLPEAEFAEILNKFNTDTAYDRLRRLDGMEKVVEQIDNYLENLEYARANAGRGPRFRPHLVFIGNPGTGKTTVARLLAEILQERGLLGRGHLIQATAGDLIGQYVGETRIKTQALCDRAAGGVLFVDEAYGLMSGAGARETVDYGKEAIEVLIQFMENRSDSVVILAGYPGQMENLLIDGNEGLAGRFNGEDSMIRMEDYRPDALYRIFVRNMHGTPTTPKFDEDIRRIITAMFVRRNSSWRNAAQMEVLASAILANWRKAGASGPVDISNIPENFAKTIQKEVSVDDILKEINALTGLPEIKERLETLTVTTLEERKLNEELGIVSTKKPNLNFVFLGNPGTGKTTVARLMARILYNVGLINSPQTVTLTKDKLVKGYQGGTAAAIQDIFRKNAGKVLFIDEAYKLRGNEAVDQITECLTDERFMGNQAVIFAGYTHDMQQLLAENSGLASRFGEDNMWLFEDYDEEALWQIVSNTLTSNQLGIREPELCRALSDAWFISLKQRRGKDFGNARDAIGLADTLRKALLRRRRSEGSADTSVAPVDFPNYANIAPKASIASPVAAATAATPANIPGMVNISLPAAEHPRRVHAPADFKHAVGLVQTPDGVGTGCFISVDDGLILTAAHVVNGHSDFHFVRHRGADAVEAELLWINTLTDHAILRARSVPDDARHFAVDTGSEEPQPLENVIHCGYRRGTGISSNFFTDPGHINNYDPHMRVNSDCVFDVIYSAIDAAPGCSGGPLLRSSDLALIGTLFGGSETDNLRIFSDVHQLFKIPTLKVKLHDHGSEQ